MEFIDKIYSKVADLFNFFDVEHLLYYFSVAPAMLLLELLIVGWERSSIRKITKFNKSVRTDVVFFLLDAFNVYNLLTVIVSFGVFHVLARLVFEVTDFNLIATITNPYIQFGVLFVMSDFKNYFSHWLFHKNMSLWSLHELHHSATDFCMLTRHRGHFLETAMKRMIDVIPFAILGSVETYIAVKVLSEAHQLVLHSSIKSNWGFLGRYLLVSPNAHRLHHSINKQHYGKNFGSTFIVWDKIFGTYYEPVAINELGTEGHLYNREGTIRDVVRGLRNFFTNLRG
jgi:sterol desaturase/sphingolipid hydroxylase (fatty acid hydroxylase superfamily)